MASEGLSMLSCAIKYAHVGNPYGIPSKSLDRNFTILANEFRVDVCSDKFDSIEGIFRDVARKHLSIRQTCMQQQDAIPKVEKELRNRIPGIFSGPPLKIEKMLLVAYRIVATLHAISKNNIPRRKNNRAQYSLSKRADVLDLTQDSDSDASYKGTGDQDTDNELDVEGGGAERRRSLRRREQSSTSRTVLETVEAPQNTAEVVHRTEPPMYRSNSQQNSLPMMTTSFTTMSGSEINRARAQWPLRYPYFAKPMTTGNSPKGHDKENAPPADIVAGSSMARNVHRHREPLPATGNLQAAKDSENITIGTRPPTIGRQEDPIIIPSTPPRATIQNIITQSVARKPQLVTKAVITAEPSKTTPESTPSSPIPEISVVEKFLHACQPPMDHLLPLFQKSGCITGAYLRSIAKRGPQEREALLRKILLPPGREGSDAPVGDIDIWMLDLHLEGYDFGDGA